jgi:hypothetical protein
LRKIGGCNAIEESIAQRFVLARGFETGHRPHAITGSAIGECATQTFAAEPSARPQIALYPTR